ncbi:MAG: Thioesterase domain [Pseudomonadota bacterium]|jgi:pimeloyl-ACP methyl ester carboxylesterase
MTLAKSGLRIVYIAGSMNRENTWRDQSIVLGRNLAEDLRRRGFSEVLEFHRSHWPHQVGRVRRIVDEVSERFDDGIQTVFVGHSLGGVIAHGVAQRLEADTLAVVAIHAPLRIGRRIWGVDYRKTKVPTLAIAGTLDLLVPRHLSVWRGMTATETEIVHTEHSFGYQYVSRLRNRLADRIATFIETHVAIWKVRD